MDNVAWMYSKIYFAQWLLTEMQTRRMSQAELARKSGLSRAMISRTLSQQSFPSWEACISIARGLDLPPENVLRAAGMLPAEIEEVERVSEQIAHYKIAELTDEQVDEVLRFIEFVQDRDERPKRKDLIDRYTREGETPPEVIKK